MGYEDRYGEGFENYERHQPSRSERERFMQRRPRWQQQRGSGRGESFRFDPRERPFGDEDFGQERESWREPHDMGERELFDYERGGQFGGPYGSPLGRERQQRQQRYGGEPWEQQERDQTSRFTRGTHSGRGPKGYKRSDERILEEANQCLWEHPDVDASELEISVKNGELTIRGSVPERRMKRLAEEALENLPGVEDVRNEIRASSRQQEQQSRAGETGMTHNGGAARSRQHEGRQERS